MQMMFQESTFNLAYIDEVEAQLLELPYIGQELSMFILLPDENVNLRLVRVSGTPWHKAWPHNLQ